MSTGPRILIVDLMFLIGLNMSIPADILAYTEAAQRLRNTQVLFSACFKSRSLPAVPLFSASPPHVAVAAVNPSPSPLGIPVGGEGSDFKTKLEHELLAEIEKTKDEQLVLMLINQEKLLATLALRDLELRACAEKIIFLREEVHDLRKKVNARHDVTDDREKVEGARRHISKQ